jgi:hypothetical protein
MLDREEYIEQAYFFRALALRLKDDVPIQDAFVQIRMELLATTKLPIALDFLVAELKHQGVFGSAMARLGHYFSPFQTYVISEAESERGRFDFRLGLEILRLEAEYRGAGGTPQGIFLYQFEALARNRLSYDRGLKAMSGDPAFDEAWRDWILFVRRQVGVLDLADMIYTRSEHYLTQQRQRRRVPSEGELPPILFGEKEGRIALANRQKDPLYLFAAMQRQLGYPVVPRPKAADEAGSPLPRILSRLDQLEQRIKLLEEEQKGGIDLTKFYGPNK